MQHSSLVLFCDECGLANEVTASHCAGCQSPLVQADDRANAPSVVPLRIAPPPVRAVTPGPMLAPASQGVGKRPRRYPLCSFQPGSLLVGRYEIKEEIGQGGFSIVYRAIDQEVGYKASHYSLRGCQHLLCAFDIVDRV